jgi:hypothetical protein
MEAGYLGTSSHQQDCTGGKNQDCLSLLLLTLLLLTLPVLSLSLLLTLLLTLLVLTMRLR